VRGNISKKAFKPMQQEILNFKCPSSYLSIKVRHFKKTFGKAAKTTDEKVRHIPGLCFTGCMILSKLFHFFASVASYEKPKW
jgi:hypothetical protein